MTGTADARAMRHASRAHIEHLNACTVCAVMSQTCMAPLALVEQHRNCYTDVRMAALCNFWWKGALCGRASSSRMAEAAAARKLAAVCRLGWSPPFTAELTTAR
jgi:hypothetical protein